jgi:hypothetical protein
LAETKATINILANASQAMGEIQKLSKAYSAFNSTLSKSNAIQADAAKNLQRNLVAGINATEGFNAEVLRMRTSASQLDSTLSSGKATMGQYFSAKFRKDGVAASQVMSLANQRAAAMNTQFFATSQAMGGFRDVVAARPLTAFNSEMAVAAQRTAIMRSMLRQSTTQMINFGKNVQWAGRQIMVGFTIPLTIFGTVAGNVFRDLEKEAVNFRKVYGDMFTTDVETEKALDGIKELSKEFTKLGIAAKDTMKLAALAAQAGQRGAQLTAATTQATRLATLGDMGGEDAMRTTIALQSAFKLSNEDLADSINFLNAVENQTVLSLQDLAGAIPRVAPVIVGLGGDVKTMAVFLAAMREGGVGAAEAANGLKSSLGRLITPTKQAKEMAAEFGISLENIVQKNKGDILATVMDLARAMEGLEGLQKQQLLSTVFGKFQFARIGALFENITREGSQAMTVMNMLGMSVEDLAKTADKELKAIEESPAVKLTKAMEDLKLAIAPIGEMFVKMAIPVLQFLGKLLEKFNQLPGAIKNIIGLGTIFAGVIIPVATMMLGLFINLTGQLIKFGSTIGIALKGFMTGGIKGAVDAVSQSFRYMSLSELDTANASRQLGSAIEIANKSMITQGTAAKTAAVSVNQLTAALNANIAAQRFYAAGAAGAMFVPAAAASRAGVASKAVGKIKLNKGGRLPGFGQNKDTLPAMLTPGEFVVNRPATEQNLPLLHAINNGEKIPGFMAGAHIGKAAGKAIGVPFPEAGMGDYAARLALLGSSGKGPGVAKIAGQKYQRTHTAASRPALQREVDEMLLMDPNNPIAILGKKGLPVEALTDSWIRLPDSINQVLKQRSGIVGRELKPLLEAVDTTKEELLGPALRGKFGPKQIIDDIAESLDDNIFYSDRGGGGRTLDSILQEVAKKRMQSITPKFDELRMPTLRSLSGDPKFSNTVRQAQVATGKWVQDPSTGLWFNKPARGAKILVAEDASGRNAMPLAGSLMPDRTLSAMKEKLITGNIGGFITKQGITRLTPKGGSGPDAMDIVKQIRGQKVSEKVRAEMITDRLAAADARISGSVASSKRAGEARKLEEQIFSKLGNERKVFSLLETNPQQVRTALAQSLKDSKPVTPRELIAKAKMDADLRHAKNLTMVEYLDDGTVKLLEHRMDTIGLNRAGNLTMMARGPTVPGGSSIQVPQNTLLTGKNPFGSRSDVSMTNIDREGRFGWLTELMIATANKGGIVGYNGGGSVSQKTKEAVRAGKGIDPKIESQRSKIETRIYQNALAKTKQELERRGFNSKNISQMMNRFDRTNARGLEFSHIIAASQGGADEAANIMLRMALENRLLGSANSESARNVFRHMLQEGIFKESDAENLKRFFRIDVKGGGPVPQGNHPRTYGDLSFYTKALEKLENFVRDKNSKISPVGESVDELLKSRYFKNQWPLMIKEIMRSRMSMVKKAMMARFGIGAAVVGAGTLGVAGAAGAFSGNKQENVAQKLNIGGQVFDSSRKNVVPGVGNRDTVPASLTPGEFVINKQATQRNRSLLEAINSGMPVSKFAEGGIVFDERAKRFRDLATGRFVSAGAAQAAGAANVGAAAGTTSKAVSGLAKVAKFAGPMVLSMVFFIGAMEAAKKAGMGEMGSMTVGMIASMAAFIPLKFAVAALSSKLLLLALPITALIATFALTDRANKNYAKKGKELADVMTTSIKDIQSLGETASQRSQRNQQYLKALETESIEAEFAGKIAKAKNAEDKKALELQRDKLIQERKSITRGEAIDKFYKEEIAAAKKRGDSEERISKLYEQRNEALGKRFEEAADFDFEKTFGAQFLTGKGEQDFVKFKELAGKGTDPTVRKAELDAIKAIGEAAYGLSLTTEEIAQREVATKLAQYILSGQMTHDQARSIADAIGQQEGDLRISANIKQQLSALGGFMGADFEFSPGAVANRLADIDRKRVEAARSQVGRSAAGSFERTGSEDFTQVRVFDQVSNFFSGQADEFRRSVSFLVTAEANQIGMLQENISAVGLQYDDLISKAKNSAEAESLRLERTFQIEKLQKRYDDARMQVLKSLGIATEEQRQATFGVSAMQGVFGREDRLSGMRQFKVGSLGNLREAQQTEAFGITGNVLKTLNVVISSVTNSFAGLMSGIQKNVGEPIASWVNKNFPTDVSVTMRTALSESVKEAQKGTQDAVVQAVLIGLGKEAGVTPDGQLMTQLNLLYLESPERWQKATAGLTAALTTLETKIQDPTTTKDQINELERQRTEIVNMFENMGFGVDTISELGQLLALSSQSAESLSTVFDIIEKGAMHGEQGVARLLPLMIKMAELNNFKLQGGQTLLASIAGDAQNFAAILEDDTLYEQLMKLTEAVALLGEEAQIAFLQTMTPENFMALAKTLDSYDFTKFGKDAQEAISGLQDASKGLTPDELKKFSPFLKDLQADFEKISKVKDPKLKLSMQQNIIPQLIRINQLLTDYANAKTQAEKETILELIVNVSTQASMDAGKTKDGKEIKELGGSGGAKPDPYQELVRPIRQRIDLLAKEGKAILGSSDKAKGLFEQARQVGMGEGILSYIRSLSAEDQINVLQQVLKSQAKRNTLMKLAQEDALASGRDALKVQKERTTFTKKLADSTVVSGVSLMRGMEALENPELISDLMKIRGPKRNQAMKQRIQDFMSLQESARQEAINMAPMALERDIQNIRFEQKAQRDLSATEFTQEEAKSIMQNANLRMMVERSIEKTGKISQDIIAQAKEFVKASKTTAELIKEGMDTIEDAFEITADTLELESSRIQRNIINPLEKQLSAFRDQANKLGEEQRRLNKSLSEISKLEKTEQERVQEIEEQINEEYDARLSALDKIEQANQRIADQQQGQIDLASALSRGDIAGAAKAQIEMQKRAAQNQLTDTKEGLREKQEKTIAKIREESEQKIKGFTAEVNGQLLTREQIELRIEQIEDILYQNSLNEYDIEQKITAEKKKQEEIQERINRLGEVSNIIKNIQRIADTQNVDLRKALLGFVKKQIEFLGGQEGASLSAALAQNEAALLSGGEAADMAVLNIAGQAAPTAIGAIGIALKDIVSPETLKAVQDASTNANTAINNVFEGTTENIAELNKELDKNPFDLLIEGLKKFKDKAKEVYAAILPPPGSGGGGKKPGDGKEEGSSAPPFGAPRMSSPISKLEQQETLRFVNARNADRTAPRKDTYFTESLGGPSSALGNIDQIITQNLEKFVQAGVSLTAGIFTGMGNYIKDQGSSFINGIKDSIIGYFKSVFQFGSPSILMQEQIGKPVGEGLLQGIKNFLNPANFALFLMNPIGGLLSYFLKSLGIGADRTSSNSPDSQGKSFAQSLLDSMGNSIVTKLPGLNPSFTKLLADIASWLGIGTKDEEKQATSNSPFSMGASFIGRIFGGMADALLPANVQARIGSAFNIAITEIKKILGIEGNIRDSWLWKTGEAMVNRIAEGISNSFDQIINTMKAKLKEFILSSKLPDFVKNMVIDVLQLAYGGKVKGNEMAYGGKVNYKGSREVAPGLALGGSIVPGMGNTDRVPAMLMPGEYVVNKASTRAFLPILQAINGSKFPSMLGNAGTGKIGPLNLDFNNISKANIGPINRENISNVRFNVPQKFNSSVDVETRNVSMIDASERNNSYFLNIDAGGSNASPDSIANAVIGKIRMMEEKQIRGVRR